jgi:hypothetical protein
MKNVLAPADFESIKQRIASLHNNSVRKWGVLSVAQMLAHCADQIKLAMGNKQPHETPTFINRNIAKYLGLWLPQIPFKNMKAPVDMNFQQYGSIAADVETEKEQLQLLLQQFITLPTATTLQPHPMFGKLNRQQWARFMYVHLDHHLRQFSV